MSRDKELTGLLSLLDDADDNVGVPVLAALLERHTALLPHLAKLQDSDDPVVRKRVHQLQSILTIRERRYTLLEKIEKASLTYPEYLLELHLQWFDCDMPDEISGIFSDFENEFKKSGISNLTEAAQYMLEKGFYAVQDTALEPELYTLGPAFTYRKIAESAVCGLIRYLLPECGIEVYRRQNKFVLTDGEVTVIPSDFWKITSETAEKSDILFDDAKLMKFALAMIFSYSVSQDHFRYIYTVGQALTGSCDDSFLDSLPYPYRNLPEEVYEKQNSTIILPNKGE